MVSESPKRGSGVARPSEMPLFSAAEQHLAGSLPSRNTDLTRDNTPEKPHWRSRRPGRMPGTGHKALPALKNPRRSAGFSSICRESWYIAKNAAHEARADVPRPGFRRPAAALFQHLPRRGAGRARRAGRHRRLRPHRRPSAPRAAPTSSPAATRPAARRRLRLFSTWEITKYLIPVATAHFRRVLRANPELPQGRTETAGRRQMVHPRRGAAAARAFRRRGQPRQGIPPLPPGRAAGQGLRGGELQGRRRQDLDGRAPRDVGGPRRLPGAGDRPRQPGLDDLDLRRLRSRANGTPSSR